MLLTEVQPVQRTGSPRAFTVSVLFHAAAVALLLTIRFAPALVRATPWHATLIAPPRELPAPPKVYVTPPPVPRFHPVVPAPRAVETKVVLEAPPPLEIHREPAPAVPMPRVIPPPPVLKTDNLGETRVAPAPVQPKIPLRTAGFTATETSAPVRETIRIASTGSFDSVETAAGARVRTVTHSSGFSDAASAAIEPVKRSITPASFGDTTVAARTAAPREAASGPLRAPIEIQFKPRPVYTEEARRLRLEGEVLVEAVFEASGALQIVRVVRGLGHGLDESAVAAARAIRFRPAQRGGRAVDSTAIVHIAFQLAY